MKNNFENIMVWPSPFIFWTKIENHNELKDRLLPQIKERILNDQLHNSPGNVHRIPGEMPSVWQCEVITSYFNRKEEEKIFDEEIIKSIIVDPLKKFFNNPNCPVKNKPKKTKLKEIWFNYYKPGYWQEVHSHTGTTYSGIYILELNEPNTTKFLNYSMQKYNYSSNKLEMEYDTKHIEEGNVIIFPSELPHSVEISTQNRCTVSFNILCE